MLTFAQPRPAATRGATASPVHTPTRGGRFARETPSAQNEHVLLSSRCALQQTPSDPDNLSPSPANGRRPRIPPNPQCQRATEGRSNRRPGRRTPHIRFRPDPVKPFGDPFLTNRRPPRRARFPGRAGANHRAKYRAARRPDHPRNGGGYRRVAAATAPAAAPAQAPPSADKRLLILRIRSGRATLAKARPGADRRPWPQGSAGARQDRLDRPTASGNCCAVLRGRAKH